jgi:methionine synthase II (cobalamin-independent)
LIHHIYIAESAFATTIAAIDADDVAIMSIENEGNFNQAMAMGNMLRGAAGVVSLRNNKDSFYEVKASLAQCKETFRGCSVNTDCCEYK